MAAVFFRFLRQPNRPNRAEASGEEWECGWKGRLPDFKRETLIRSCPPRPDIGAGCHA